MNITVSKICCLAFVFTYAATQAKAQQSSPLTITRTAANTYKLAWMAEDSRAYQLQSSVDMQSWLDFGGIVSGSGTMREAVVTSTTPDLFFRLRNPVIRGEFLGEAYEGFLWADDDNSSNRKIDFGFAINLFGQIYDKCWVNNNGNITFGDSGLSDYTPLPMQGLGFPIIAPFWADVDTSKTPDTPKAATVATYGKGIVNGRPAFAATWNGVGYFAEHSDKLNYFQLVLIERSDTGTNNFDIEFNYAQVLWETGDFSGGKMGYGGVPAREGITDGGTKTVELAYSGVKSVQLNADPVTRVANTTTGLIYRTRNSTLPGRYVFQVRSGQIVGALNVDAGPDQTLAAGTNSVTLSGTAADPSGGAVSVRWAVATSVAGSSGVTFSNPAILNPIVTIPANENPNLILTATSTTDPSISATDTVKIKH